MLLTLAAAAAVVACEDDAVVNPRATLSFYSLTLVVGEEAVVTASCRAESGRLLRGHAMDLVAFDPHVADGIRSGDALRIRAIAPGQARVVANCEPGSPVYEVYVGDPAPPYVIASVTVIQSPITAWSLELEDDTLELLRTATQGERRRLSITARDATGTMVPATGLTFTADDLTVVTVDALGMLAAQNAGSAHVIVAGHGKQDTVNIQVTTVADFGAHHDVDLFGALWTQGTQNVAGTIPMIYDGRSAVVSVVAVADGAMVPERAVLRLFNADSLLIHSDTAPLRVAPLTTPTHATPSAQFLVPPATVNVTRWWEVVRDPVFGGPDASALNDRFPRRGSASLHLVSVPAIRIRLVPIRLSQHGGVTPVVAGAASEDFLWYLRTRFPFARIDVTLGAPLVSDANFVNEGGGEPGGTAFFTRVLHEVDLARSAHPDAADHYWVGVLPQPPGMTVTRWAGLAYIPLQGAGASIFARSQVIVGREWYGTAPQAAGRNLAHELGHNLGRWHAPCGDAVQYDHSFEPSDGRIGPWVHLVNEWADGVADSAAVNDPQAYGDIMSFCGPRAVGPYTYAGILRFRQLFGAALVAADEPRRVLVVRGTYGPNGVRVAPVQTLVARASAPSDAGGVWVDLLGADGRVLETVRAQVGAHGEAGTDRPFGVQLALTRSVEAALRSIRVRTPVGVARLESPAAVAGRALSTAPAMLP